MAVTPSPALPALPWLPWPTPGLEVDLLALLWWIIFWAWFTYVLCFLSGREQHQKHLQGEETLWVGMTLSPGTQNLLLPSQASSFFPNHRENDHLVPAALGTPCASRSINPVAICCLVVPALLPLCQPQLQKIKRSRILVDGNRCRNAFLCFFPMRMKGPGLAGAGNEALGCSFYWALCRKTQTPPALLSSLLLKGLRTDAK